MNIATKIKILFLSVTLFLLPSLSGAEMANYNLDVISSQSDYAFFTTTNAINDLGQVVGVGQVGSTQYPLSWDIGDGFTTLTNPGVAGGINNLGQLIISNSFRVYDSDGTELYSHDVYDGIGTDINNNTEVAGVTFFNGSLYHHAFLWDETNGMEDLGTLGGDWSFAHAINDNGHVVGRSTVEGGLIADQYAFLWTRDDGIMNLGVLSGIGSASEAYDINNNNKVIGVSYSSTIGRAFIWDSVNGMQNLGTLLNSSSAVAVNDSDLVIGNCHGLNGESLGFIWSEADGMVDLSDLLSNPYSSYDILDVYDINNNNQIVALAELDGVEYHVLLTPVPEPISLLMLTMGSFAVLRRKANRRFFH